MYEYNLIVINNVRI